MMVILKTLGEINSALSVLMARFIYNKQHYIIIQSENNVISHFYYIYEQTLIILQSIENLLNFSKFL